MEPPLFLGHTGMEIGIIGLPRSGKTAAFTALTKVAPSPGSGKANIGVAHVPDPRLGRLAEIFKPRRVVQAEVFYVDFPGLPEGSQRRGIEGEQLNRLQRVDALLNVARAFDNPAVPQPDGGIDPFRDLEVMELELAFSDLAILERRAARLESDAKSNKAQVREAAKRERQWLEGVKTALEAGQPLRAQETTADQARQLSNFQFLTAKPILHALNIGEGRLGEVEALEAEMAARAGGPKSAGFVLAAGLESDLAMMDPGDEAEFRESLDAGESGLERGIRCSYDLLGLVSFLTVGEDEVRAWPVPANTPAVRAAGTIHSDLERGFIRAEVVRYEDFIDAGSLAEARKRGVLRTEGKTYSVQDGDIMNVLFSV